MRLGKQTLQDKLEAADEQLTELRQKVGEAFAGDKEVSQAIAQCKNELEGKQKAAQQSTADCNKELEDLKANVASLATVEEIRVATGEVSASVKKVLKGALREYQASLRSLAKLLEEQSRTQRVGAQAARVSAPEAAPPIHAIVLSLASSFEDTVGNSLHEARGGINAAVIQPQMDLHKLLAGIQFIKRATKDLQQHLKVHATGTVDVKEPPVLKKLLKILQKAMDPGTLTTTALPTAKGASWAGKVDR